jgi:hypothetical protein
MKNEQLEDELISTKAQLSNLKKAFDFIKENKKKTKDFETEFWTTEKGEVSGFRNLETTY